MNRTTSFILAKVTKCMLTLWWCIPRVSEYKILHTRLFSSQEILVCRLSGLVEQCPKWKWPLYLWGMAVAKSPMSHHVVIQSILIPCEHSLRTNLPVIISDGSVEWLFCLFFRSRTMRAKNSVHLLAWSCTDVSWTEVPWWSCARGLSTLSIHHWKQSIMEL